VPEGLILVAYEIVAFLFLVGIVVPVAIYWYISRPHIKAHFTTRKSARERETPNTYHEDHSS